jgi:hypothetical protein
MDHDVGGARDPRYRRGANGFFVRLQSHGTCIASEAWVLADANLRIPGMVNRLIGGHYHIGNAFTIRIS